jgi:hypothetical protein
MEKEIMQKQLLWMEKDTPITWKDIKHIKFQDDDVIQCFENGYNGSWFAYIVRQQLETDEEFEERKKTLEKMRESSREKRYQKYLKLKEEFENE